MTYKANGNKINGWKIKRMIRERNQTQSDLANRAGVTRTCITLVLNGKTCSYKTVESIADALGVTVDSILLKR